MAGSLACLPDAFLAELTRCDSAEVTSFAELINITYQHTLLGISIDQQKIHIHTIHEMYPLKIVTKIK